MSTLSIIATLGAYALPAAASQVPLLSPPALQPALHYCPQDNDQCRQLLTAPWPKQPGHRRPVPDLLQRRYGDLTNIGTHDAVAIRTADNNWSLAGNQYFDITTQLDAGVRMIQAQGHMDPFGSGTVRLCHTNCALMDGGSLLERLTDVKRWLDANPNEVLTLLFVNAGVPFGLWAQAYHDTGLDVISYIPPPHPGQNFGVTDWPTLGEMVANGTRLVTFLSAGANEEDVPWLLNEFDYIFETAYNNDSPSDFDCAVNRPRLGDTWPPGLYPDRLTLVNHFLYAKLFGFRYPNATYANHTNGAGFAVGELGEHAVRCRDEYNRRPNFLLVDFFNEGDVFEVEAGMNWH